MPRNAKAAKPAAKQKHDWQLIRSEYVEATSESTRPTLEALATKHNCSPSYLREKASKENWKQQAEDYLTAIARERQAVKVTATASEQALWDQQCFKLTQAAIGQLHRHLKTAIESQKSLSLKEIDELSKSLERLHSLGREALGEEPEIEESTSAEYSTKTPDELAQLYQQRLKRPGASK